MATTADTHRRTLMSLRTIELMVGDLPEVAAEWDDLPIDERMSWSLDWSSEMSALERLARAAADGTLPPEAVGRYRDLLRRVHAALPTLRRLNLYQPSVPDPLHAPD